MKKEGKQLKTGKRAFFGSFALTQLIVIVKTDGIPAKIARYSRPSQATFQNCFSFIIRIVIKKITIH